ncbi:putative unspecific monooxygenase [Lupinus albus]|uniref:Putative unspecific monooxygenase n=1 Tax=Lupinus albus TaxID=3870 RepID=A0A6A4QCI0_LUPAL|nr:putative unspecific monooxygenase [Lupinus albus]
MLKAMINLMVDSAKIVISSWESKVERDGGVSEIKVDEDLQNLSADVIAKACFGSNYIEAKEIFTKLRDIQRLMSTIFAYAGIPGFRYIPIRTNREIWKIEKEIDRKIMKLIKQRLDHGEEKDLLQMILEGANSYEEKDRFTTNYVASRERFIIDNCKNIFSAGHETTSITASWCLMLLASNQVWQDRVRAEVLQVCGNDPLNATMLRSMDTLNMVIQETLRLYPPSAFVNREATEDININGFQIPKGMNIQIPIAVMQQDPELWGSDAHKFNPERFSNGVIRASKFPQAYTPFGIGPRVCVGQHLAMTELKVILSLILINFQFSISSTYCHSPVFHMLIESHHGVLLKVTKI